LPVGVRPLLDTAVGGSSGGSGRSFDWPRARQVPEAVIAGGLGPDNVGLAIAAARPWGVDASSRLELEPGRKDHSKVAAFIEAAKSA
jgi:phosphoribosylanthranilate isomerase